MPAHAAVQLRLYVCAARDNKTPLGKDSPYRHVTGGMPIQKHVKCLHTQHQEQRRREAELAAPLGKPGYVFQASKCRLSACCG